MKKIVAQIGLVSLLFFSLTSNAATINVAKGASIGDAVKNAVAHDIILVAADTFTESASILIDKPLTIIGHKDSTVIKRKAQDSLATIKIIAKNVYISNLTVYGHDGAIAADPTDTLTCWPTSGAILISGAESTSIYSCNLIGGKGIEKRSLAAADGGSGLYIKNSKMVWLKNDSMQGGLAHITGRLGDTLIDTEGGAPGTLQPLTRPGKPGAGLLIDTSSYIKVDGAVMGGGDGFDMNWHGEYTKGTPGMLGFRASQFVIINSTLRGGYTNYMTGDTVAPFEIYDSSIVDTANLQISGDGGYADETSIIGERSNGVLFFQKYATAEKPFVVRYRNDPLLSLSCFLTKESFVSIDLLNAKGQTIKKIRTEHAAPGVRLYTLDLTGATLSKAVYFLRVATQANRQCFRLDMVR
jgi:hypothetical protein